MVLDGGRDDMRRSAIGRRQPSCPGHATERQIVALGRPAGEDDLARLTAEHPRSLSSCPVDRRSRLRAKLLDARGIAIQLGKVRQHSLEHSRVNRRRSRMVEVNGAVWGRKCAQRDFVSLPKTETDGEELPAAGRLAGDPLGFRQVWRFSPR